MAVYRSRFATDAVTVARIHGIVYAIYKTQAEPRVIPATERTRELRQYQGRKTSDLFGITEVGSPNKIEYTTGQRNLANEAFEGHFEIGVIHARASASPAPLPATPATTKEDLEWFNEQRSKQRSFGRFLSWAMDRIVESPGGTIDVQGIGPCCLRYTVRVGRTEWYVEPADAPGEQIPNNIGERVKAGRAASVERASEKTSADVAGKRVATVDDLTEAFAAYVPVIRREVRTAVREVLAEAMSASGETTQTTTASAATDKGGAS